MKFTRIDRRDLRDFVAAMTTSKTAEGSRVKTFGSMIDRFQSTHADTMLRTIRVVTGSLILFMILVAILIPQVLPVSGDSYVNAKLEWIRSPIEGDLFFRDLLIGDEVKRGTILGTISNERTDDFFLNQLSAEKSSLDTALFALGNRQQQLMQHRDELQIKVDESLTDLKEKTITRLAIIEREVDMSKNELTSVKESLLRYQRANDDFSSAEPYAVVSRATIEALVNRKMQLETLVSSQQNSFDLLENSLDSALTASYVSQNTPVEQRQLIDIEQSLLSVEAEIEALLLKSGNLSAQIKKRSESLREASHYEMVAGVSGTIWDIGFSDGSFVNPGDSVVAITDTKTIAVEGNFHQRYLDNIKVGDTATVDLMGSDRRLKGTVTKVQIRDQIKSADLSAFNLDSPATNEFKVIVSLDKTNHQDIYIGQRAKVIIGNSPSSVLPAILMFFNR